MSSSISRLLHKHFFTTATSSFPSLLTSLSTAKNYRPPLYTGPKEIEEIVKNFKKNSKSPSFRRDISHYEATVHRLAAEKHFLAIENILEHQKKYKHNMSDEGFGVRLIGLYGKAGMFVHAYKVFDEMPKFNCPRTVMSFNAILGACVNSKNLDKVGEFFRELPEKLGVEPDVVSYNTVIKGFCGAGDFVSVMKMIEKMEESEVRADVVSYNTVLEAFYKEDKVVEAEGMWRRMVEKGVGVDTRSYNSKIRWLVKNGRVEEAFEVVEEMVNEEVKLDKFTYDALMKGCVGEGKLEEAKMYYGKMVGKGIRLRDLKTYTMLVSFACDKDDVDFAFELCKHSVKANVNIYKSLIQRLVDALIKSSKIEEATELVELVNASKKHRYTLALPAVTT